MKIILAKEAGFCFGVKRATEMTLKTAKSTTLCTLGPLIHNPEFTNYLGSRGILIVKNVDNIKSDSVVIRSHGVTKNIEVKIRKKGKKIIDATCPFVKRVQKLAEEFDQKGYKVLVLGEKDHSEIVGIRSYAPKSIVIKNLKDVPKFSKNEKIAFISQTTQDSKLFDDIAKSLKSKFNNLKAVKTICNATESRQKAARQLAKEVDIMIVIGGKNSSNTTRLKEICEKITTTYHIESEKEFKKEWFNSAETVGITAGASTPDFSINAVLSKLNNYEKKNTKAYCYNNGR